MKLSLARSNIFEDGNSGGHWLIRQMPGLCLRRTQHLPEQYQGEIKQGWVIIYTGVQFASAPERGIWPGEDADRERHTELSSNWPNLIKVFKTRREALSYLENQATKGRQPVLAEILGGVE